MKPRCYLGGRLQRSASDRSGGPEAKFYNFKISQSVLFA
jgi:hypothetical protein